MNLYRIITCILYAHIAAFNYHYDSLNLITLLFIESFFVIDAIINFNVAYMEETSKTIVKDRKRIAFRYLKGEYIWDFIPLLPL